MAAKLPKYPFTLSNHNQEAQNDDDSLLFNVPFNIILVTSR